MGASFKRPLARLVGREGVEGGGGCKATDEEGSAIVGGTKTPLARKGGLFGSYSLDSQGEGVKDGSWKGRRGTKMRNSKGGGTSWLDVPFRVLSHG